MIYHKNFSKIVLITITCLIVIGYIIFNFRIFIAGPQIAVSYPQDGISVTESLIEVTGLATNISQIQMNNNTIFLSEDGEFKEVLLLNPGYNIISIEAKDKFERSVSQKIHVVYQGEKIIGQAVINASSTESVGENASSTEEIESEDSINSSSTNSTIEPDDP